MQEVQRSTRKRAVKYVKHVNYPWISISLTIYLLGLESVIWQYNSKERGTWVAGLMERKSASSGRRDWM